MHEIATLVFYCKVIAVSLFWIFACIFEVVAAIAAIFELFRAVFERKEEN